jgi:hypothetical protein
LQRSISRANVEGEKKMSDRFTEAMTALDDLASPRAALGSHFIDVLPVTGAAVSTIGDPLGSETLSATDARAVRIDELQFDLGEGPCWDAVRSARPIMETDLVTNGHRRWPAFSSAIRAEPVSSIFAFPLVIGPFRFGAVDLYSRQPVTLDRTQVDHAVAMAGVVARRVLRDAVGAADRGEYGEPNPLSRRVVHQATGVVLAQLDISAEDAYLMIQGHAFAANRSVMDVAVDITQGKLRFSKAHGLIEVIE